MAIELTIGLDVITSYKRLAYTPWHALAEFVDNSTQSYFDNRAVLDESFKKTGEKLDVRIVYDKDKGFLRISDNSIGMNYEELQKALHVASPPSNTTGRSKYGMGLKTAACWIGNNWTVRTKTIGETVEHLVKIDVEEISKGQNELPYEEISDKDPEQHYTIIEIEDHNQRFQGRTLRKIRDFLSSMYREDFRNEILNLEWQGAELKWEGFEDKLLTARDGTKYYKPFAFEVDGKSVTGWVGILDKGSRADAGFSILHSGRVVRGWPDSWRPATLYGQLGGSNDLVNQRLIGEIHLDDFDVSHTKDDILWLGGQEEDVEKELLKNCNDYREIALKRRKGQDDQRGPSAVETDTAISEFQNELMSPELLDQITIDAIPEESAVAESVNRITNSVTSTRNETFNAQIGEVLVKIYIDSDLSPNDPYVLNDSAQSNEVVVIVNTSHPHWSQLQGSEGVLNYLRHCTYDAIAEWQAINKAARMDPDTIKLLKDKLLRVPMEMERHQDDAEK